MELMVRGILTGDMLRRKFCSVKEHQQGRLDGRNSLQGQERPEHLPFRGILHPKNLLVDTTLSPTHLLFKGILNPKQFLVT
jgi:hypothetical protein